jgi:hypothetical protein
MSINDSLLTGASATKGAAISAADPVAAGAALVPLETVVTVADAVGKGGFGAQATVGQLVEFQLTGLLVVFTVLGGLTLICYLLGWILKTVAPNHYFVRSAQPAAATAPAPKPLAPAVHAAAPTIHPGLADEELIAILAAAASETMGQSVSIVSFRPMDSMDWRWSIQGRVDHHSSHAR